MFIARLPLVVVQQAAAVAQPLLVVVEFVAVMKVGQGEVDVEFLMMGQMLLKIAVDAGIEFVGVVVRTSFALGVHRTLQQVDIDVAMVVHRAKRRTCRHLNGEVFGTIVCIFQDWVVATIAE